MFVRLFEVMAIFPFYARYMMRQKPNELWTNINWTKRKQKIAKW